MERGATSRPQVCRAGPAAMPGRDARRDARSRCPVAMPGRDARSRCPVAMAGYDGRADRENDLVSPADCGHGAANVEPGRSRRHGSRNFVCNFVQGDSVRPDGRVCPCSADGLQVDPAHPVPDLRRRDAGHAHAVRGDRRRAAAGPAAAGASGSAVPAGGGPRPAARRRCRRCERPSPGEAGAGRPGRGIRPQDTLARPLREELP